MTPWCSQNPKHPLVLHKIDCVQSKGLIPGRHRALSMSAGGGSLGSQGSLRVLFLNIWEKAIPGRRQTSLGSLSGAHWSLPTGPGRGREKLRGTCLEGNVSPNCSAGGF